MLGIRSAPDGAPHLLELPLRAHLHNHLGTMHAAAEFALAEAASAECLRRGFPDLVGRVLAVMRSADIRYRQAATTELHAFARLDAPAAAAFRADLQARRQAFVTVTTELRAPAGGVAFAGDFKWYVGWQEPPP